MEYKNKLRKISAVKLEVEISLTKEQYEEEKKMQLKRLGRTVKVKGFRPGKAPDHVLEAELGYRLIEETLERLLPKATYEVLKENGYEKVINVSYEVKKFELEEGIEFIATVYLYPEFDIPDLKKIKVKKEDDKVTKEELDEFYTNFVNDLIKRKEKDSKDKLDAEKVDDKWIESQNIPNVKTKEELIKFLEEYLAQQKKESNHAKYVNSIIDSAMTKVKIEVPDVLIDAELNERERQNRERLEGLGIKWEEWLKQQKTDEEKLKEQWRDDVKSLIERQMFLSKLADSSGVEVTDEEIEKSMENIGSLANYPAADLERFKVNMKNQIFDQRLTEWLVKQVEG